MHLQRLLPEKEMPAEENDIDSSILIIPYVNPSFQAVPGHVETQKVTKFKE